MMLSNIGALTTLTVRSMRVLSFSGVSVNSCSQVERPFVSAELNEKRVVGASWVISTIASFGLPCRWPTVLYLVPTLTSPLPCCSTVRSSGDHSG